MRGEMLVWETFARDRGFRFTAPSGYPNDDLVIEAHVDGAAIETSTRTQRKGRVETRTRADARHAMLGRVEIRAARWTDRVTGIFLGRSATGHADLDARLSTFTSSSALLATILDPLTIEVLRALADKPRFALVYESGAITIRWAGVESSAKPLGDAVRLAAHLSIAGTELSPYR